MSSIRRWAIDVPRIAIAGFQHETNSFATTIAGLAEFEMADAWPPLLRGADVISGTHGMNLPIAGFAGAAASRPDVTLVPILWCSAEPNGPVTRAAFDTIAAEILDGLRAARPLDGIYLDLHGAMITETHFDGEGALLRMIRAEVGPDLPIAISLDLHANLTQTMVDLANSIAIFRTYPHLDMAETGARCLPRLLDHIAGWRPEKAFRQCPYLIPLHAQFTGADPARALYARATDGAELAMGFTGADMRDTGPSVLDPCRGSGNGGRPRRRDPHRASRRRTGIPRPATPGGDRRGRCAVPSARQAHRHRRCGG
jgi:microcystin degradation protein MlrC